MNILSTVQPRAARGFTLIEVLVALGIVAVALAAAMSSMMVNLKANHGGEVAFEGAQAAQSVIDELRYDEVSEMPSSGSDPVRHVSSNSRRTYDVTVAYCNDASFCTSDEIRQLSLTVKYQGETIYTTQTVFTALEHGTGTATSSSSSSSSSAPASSSSTSSSTSSSSSSSSSGASSSSSSRRCRTWRC